MTTRAVFTPFSAEFPAANFPQLLVVNERPVLGYDATTGETARWTGIAPQGLTGALTAVITYMAASATTGTVQFDVALEAITDGDATDLDSATSFDSVNNGSATVPGTAGQIDQMSITLTNADSLTAADLFRLQVARNIADTATGDIYLLAVELRDAA